MERFLLICFYLLAAVACLLQGLYEFVQHARYTHKAKQKGKKFGKIFISIGLIFVCLFFSGTAFSLSFLLLETLGYIGYFFIFLAILFVLSSWSASKHYVIHMPGKKEKNK